MAGQVFLAVNHCHVFLADAVNMHEQFSLLKRWHDKLLNKALVKEKLVNLCCTHEQIKLVKEKLANLCCTHEQIKLINGKRVKENLVVCTDSNFWSKNYH